MYFLIGNISRICNVTPRKAFECLLTLVDYSETCLGDCWPDAQIWTYEVGWLAGMI